MDLWGTFIQATVGGRAGNQSPCINCIPSHLPQTQRKFTYLFSFWHHPFLCLYSPSVLALLRRLQEHRYFSISPKVCRIYSQEQTWAAVTQNQTSINPHIAYCIPSLLSWPGAWHFSQVKCHLLQEAFSESSLSSHSPILLVFPTMLCTSHCC
jgi:hypothetical protein